MSAVTSRISLIWAMANNRVIGANNTLPWKLPADLRHFRRLTSGHHIIMGRRNYESLGRALPDRVNIVVSRQPGYHAPGCTVVRSIDEALHAASGDPEIFVIGGATIYAQTLDRADRLYVTLINAKIPGDTVFPDFEGNAWLETAREEHTADQQNRHSYTFITLDRKPAQSASTADHASSRA